MIRIIGGIIVGAICGAITALLGYAKSVTVEKFESKKAVQTLVVGAAIGAVGAYYGWTYEKAEEWAMNIGLITLLEYGKKSIYRMLKPPKEVEG